MKRSNLIPITRIYDIYPKYTYSVDVKKIMDEIVDIDRASVYTKDEVIAMLTELKQKIEQLPTSKCSEIRRIYIHVDDFKDNVIGTLNKYLERYDEN